MKTIPKSITLFLLLVLSVAKSDASHLVGGEITYKWLGGNDYSINVHLYRDCMGIPIVTSASVTFTSISCNQSFSVSIPVDSNVSPKLVSPVCIPQLSNSACNGGTLYGIEEYTYSQTVTLPIHCSDWVISYSDCCRNAAITNLDNSAGQGFYIYAQLDNLNTPFNNSPSFIHIPVYVIDDNVSQQLSWSAIDSDGDSLVYSLVTALDGQFPGTPVIYSPGITFSQPFLSAINTTLNQISGVISITPAGNQINVVSMDVDEFRNGLHIGKIHRDFQIVVTNTFNHPPVLSGINGTSYFAMSACPGVPLSFNIFSNDPDSNQQLNIHWDETIDSASFTTTGGLQPNGTFNWTPDTNDIRSEPYLVVLTVDDNNCPYFGTQTYAYMIYINQCNTYDVWPGDANADAHVDLTDLLNIGIAFNDTGPLRPGASTNWSAQPCSNWSNNFASGINRKHADCDGNGLVNWNDTVAITINNGMNHPFRPVLNQSFNNAPDLILVANYDTVGPNTAIDFDIYLGTASVPVDIYGISFGVTFDWTKIPYNSIAVDFSNCWLGTVNTNIIAMYNVDINGVINMAFTGINHSDFSGYGLLAHFSLLVVGSGPALMEMPFDIISVKAIKANEQHVALNVQGTKVYLDPFSGTGLPDDNGSKINVKIFPNPVGSDKLLTVTSDKEINAVQINNITGALIRNEESKVNSCLLNLDNIVPGFYTITVFTESGLVTQKLIVQ